MGKYVIGIDLGGTFIKAAAFDFNGALLVRSRVATGVSKGKQKVVDNIVAAINSIKGSLSGDDLAALGIGVAGIIDVGNGAVVKSPNFPGWEGYALLEQLNRAVRKPVIIENDANASAMGEKWAGCARDMQNFLMITLGTGVGGGLVLNGELWRGEHGRAGEFGHMKVEIEGEPCGCGSDGCLETRCSAKAITRMALEAIKAGRATSLAEFFMGGQAGLDSEKIHRAALAGDAVAIEIYRTAATYLAMGISAVINLIDVTNFVIGGGVSKAFDLFAPQLRSEIARMVFGIDEKLIVIIKSQLGDDAGLYGSAYLALRSLAGRSNPENAAL